MGGRDAGAQRSTTGERETTQRLAMRAFDLCCFATGDPQLAATVTSKALEQLPPEAGDAEMERAVVRAVSTARNDGASVPLRYPRTHKHAVDDGRDLLCDLISNWSATERVTYALAARHRRPASVVADAMGTTARDVEQTVRRLNDSLSLATGVTFRTAQARVAFPPLRAAELDTADEAPEDVAGAPARDPYVYAAGAAIGVGVVLVAVGLGRVLL